MAKQPSFCSPELSKAIKDYGTISAGNVPAGYYSKLEKTLNDLITRKKNPINIHTKQNLVKYLKKQGISDEEMEWSGLTEQLKQYDNNDKIKINELDLEFPELEEFRNTGGGVSEEFIEEEIESRLSSVRDSGEIYDTMDEIYYNNYYVDDYEEFSKEYDVEIRQHMSDNEMGREEAIQDLIYGKMDGEWTDLKQWNEEKAYEDAEEMYREQFRDEVIAESDEAASDVQYGSYSAADEVGGEEYQEVRMTATGEHVPRFDNSHWHEDNVIHHRRSSTISKTGNLVPNPQMVELREKKAQARATFEEYSQGLIDKYGDAHGARDNATQSEIDEYRRLYQAVEDIKVSGAKNVRQGDVKRLFVEEIQSDVHQGGGKYESKVTTKDRSRVANLEARVEDLKLKRATAASHERAARFDLEDALFEIMDNVVGEKKYAGSISHYLQHNLTGSIRTELKTATTVEEVAGILRNIIDDSVNVRPKNAEAKRPVAEALKADNVSINRLSELLLKELDFYREKTKYEEAADRANKAWIKAKQTKADAPYRDDFWWKHSIKNTIDEAILGDFNEIAFNTANLKNGSFLSDEKVTKGAKTFYDEKVVQFMNKYVRQFDKTIKMKTDTVNGIKMYVYPITEKFKKAVKEQGQSLFGVPAAFGLGAMLDDEEATEK